MKYYVQLKDGVVFAAHESSNDVDDSGPNVWSVDEDGSDKIGKLYNNGNFSDAPLIKYATLDSNSNVVEIKETVYSSEVSGPIIDNDQVTFLWKWDGQNFLSPAYVAPVEITPVEIVTVDVPEQITYESTPNNTNP
jgi:hypothetical protein